VSGTHEQILAAAQMVDDLDAQRQRENDAFRAGFELGFHHGVDVGHGHGRAETLEWLRVDRPGPNAPSLAELLRRGHIPRDLTRPPALPRAWWTAEECAREQGRAVA